MIYFTVEELDLLHMQIADMSGGAQGIRDIGRLESVVAAQTQVVFAKKLHESLHEIAATLAKG
ncbi:MAG: type II toxin-antitoxin system death-on-curing family toxin, partial [Candidatus Saccharimonadales bacterium]